ncbi:MAG: germination protein YpeB [Eubacteriales bacterium]|nr:germination protein YpeB [Eubacteriales bacterium]
MRYEGKELLKRWLLPAVLAAALVAAVVWGATRSAQVSALEMEQNNAYTRSVYEVTEHMGIVELDLAKLMVSGSPGVNVSLLAEIARRADGAVQSVTSLPLAQSASGSFTGFANTVGDYARALLEQASRGDPLTYEQIEQLKQLHSNCVMLNTQLKNMAQEPITFARITSESFFNWEGDELSSKLYEINQNGPEIPALIYDGPFSDALTGKAAKGLAAGIAEEAAAMAEAARYLGLNDTQSIESLGLCEGALSAFCFNATDKNGDPVYLQVSRQGCKVVLMLRDCAAQQGSITLEQCTQVAQEFLKSNGIEPVISTWTQQYGGMAVINFAAKQDSAVLYPDLIKVKVRTDTGEVAAVDAAGYYMNHTQRTLTTPQKPLEEVRQLVSSQLDIQREQLCVIPTDGGEERLVWEFMGKFADETYIVYLDVATGDEVKVFKIINTQTGALTV